VGLSLPVILVGVVGLILPERNQRKESKRTWKHLQSPLVLSVLLIVSCASLSSLIADLTAGSYEIRNTMVVDTSQLYHLSLTSTSGNAAIVEIGPEVEFLSEYSLTVGSINTEHYPVSRQLSSNDGTTNLMLQNFTSDGRVFLSTIVRDGTTFTFEIGHLGHDTGFSCATQIVILRFTRVSKPLLPMVLALLSAFPLACAFRIAIRLESALRFPVVRSNGFESCLLHKTGTFFRLGNTRTS